MTFAVKASVEAGEGLHANKVVRGEKRWRDDDHGNGINDGKGKMKTKTKRKKKPEQNFSVVRPDLDGSRTQFKPVNAVGVRHIGRGDSSAITPSAESPPPPPPPTPLYRETSPRPLAERPRTRSPTSKNTPHAAPPHHSHLYRHRHFFHPPVLGLRAQRFATPSTTPPSLFTTTTPPPIIGCKTFCKTVRPPTPPPPLTRA